MTGAKEYAGTGVMFVIGVGLICVVIQAIAVIVGLLLAPVLLGLIIAVQIRAAKKAA